MQKETGLLERVFHLSENGTSVKTEIMAGITTFMTMAYILAVNPAIMSAAGMDKGAVLTATAIAGFLGTVLMAAFSNYPFALAPGMGLNAFFAFTVVKQMGYTWEMALAAVFVEGVIFIVLSLTNVREAIFNAIPLNLKKAVSAGIGLFICFLGLANAVHHGLCHADRLGCAQLKLLLKVRLLERAVALGKGVALELVKVAQQMLGILLGDSGMQTVGLRHGIHKDRLSMPLLGLEQQHGLRRVVPKTDDGADSLTRMNDVLTD